MTVGVLPGRAAEIARVDALLAETCDGHGGALVLRGEPGIGKTRLLEETVARHPEMTVLEARGVEAEAELPFAGLFDLLRPLDGTELGGLEEAGPERTLLDRLRSGTGVSVDRFAVCTLMLRILCAVAEDRPVLVVVDDVQWLDPASADAVVFAARRARHDRVAVLLALRDRPEQGVPAALRGLDELELRGLDAPSAATVLRSRSSRPVTDDVVARLTATSAGNPLALVELSRGVDGLGPEEVWARTTHSVPELYRDRLQVLDDGARAAIVVLALDSGEWSTSLWAAAAELGVGVVEFERLELASLVAFRHGAPQLVHPLLRSSVLAEVPPPVLRSGHRAWARAIEATGTGHVARAWHLAAAAVGPDPEAATALDDAAVRAAAISAHGTAAVALERAAHLTADPSGRGDRLLRAGVSARHAGRPEDAARLLGEAAANATDPLLAAAIDGERGRRHLYHGKVTEASRLVDRAASAVASADPEAASLMLGVSSWSAMISGDHVRSVALARRARRLAHDAGARPSPLVELTLGTSLFSVGEVAQSYPLLLEVCADVEARLDEVDPEFACFAGVCLAWIGEFGRARVLIARITERARPTAAFGVLCAALHAGAYVDARTGALVAAYAGATEALEIAETTGNDLWRYFCLGCLAHIEGAQGREEDCRRHADEALALARTMDIDHPAPVREALGLLELAVGDVDAAIGHLETVNRRGSTGEIVLGRPTALDLVEAYVRAGRPLPDALADEVVAFSTDERFPGLAAACWRARGLLAADDAVDGCFAAAAALHRRAGNPLALARTRLCHGERLRRAGRRAEARDQLLAALDGFDGLAARGWSRRAEAELRAAGATQRPDAPGSGIEALTAQELQVALAVSRDLSNRQVAGELYLSPRTVEFHLGHVYRKLGIRSRTGLAAALGAGVPAPRRPEQLDRSPQVTAAGTP